ncbi:MAG TPA: histidine phosphatase family protein [Candidatus Pullilachnospira intestinigallinarum]|nr:histidine phosphatase family protein [Candidatus Pullilachnospira intestinigallinarum]
MKLYIVRHGETVWNTEGRLQGMADIELNENGIRLAKITGEKLKDIPFDLAISSPLKRAVHTARLILGDRRIPLKTDARIEEITFGEWEGLCCRKDRYEIPSEGFSLFFSDPFHYQPPAGGETVEQVIERTGDFYRELLNTPDAQDKTILITCHGCSSRALLYNISQRQGDLWRGHVPPNCSVTVVDVTDGKAQLEVVDKIYYDPDEVVDFYQDRK